MKPPLKIHSGTKSRTFVLRPYRRIPTWFVSYYMTGNAVGKGMVTDLSRTGMRVSGEHVLKSGTELTVRVSIEDHPPIEISRAAVRWVRENNFGLQILSMSPSAATRIAAVLHDEIRTPRTPL
jgi:hypothetical protein